MAIRWELRLLLWLLAAYLAGNAVFIVLHERPSAEPYSRSGAGGRGHTQHPGGLDAAADRFVDSSLDSFVDPGGGTDEPSPSGGEGEGQGGEPQPRQEEGEEEVKVEGEEEADPGPRVSASVRPATGHPDQLLLEDRIRLRSGTPPPHGAGSATAHPDGAGDADEDHLHIHGTPPPPPPSPPPRAPQPRTHTSQGAGKRKAGDAGEEGQGTEGEADQHGGEEEGPEDGETVHPVGADDERDGNDGFERWHPEVTASDGRPTTAGIAYERMRGRPPQVAIPYDDPTNYTSPGYIERCDKSHPAPHRKHGRTMGCWPPLNITELCGPKRPKLIMYPRKMKRATVVPGRVINVPRTIYRGLWGPYVMHTRPVKLIETIQDHSNAVLHSLPGSDSPPALNTVPIADSHNGEHDMFQHWPTERQVGERVKGRVERAQWGIQFHKDPRNVTGHPQLAESQPPVWVASLTDTWVFMGTAFMCGWALHGGGCQLDVMAYADSWWAVDKAVLICDGECNNYYHFTIEHLPRLALMYDKIMQDESITILVPQLSQRKAPFVHDYIVGVLGINDRRLIAADSRAPQWKTVQETVFVRRAFVPAPTVCGRPHGQALLTLRDVVFRRLGLPSVATGRPRPFRIVFAERGKFRMPRNWAGARAEILAHFPSDDVTFESVGNRSVEGQVRLFNGADMVIGPHGANLANVLWMRHGTTCLEFMPYHYGNMCYYGISSRLGLVHRFFLHSASKKGAYNITAGEVVKHITDAMLRANGQPPLTWS